MDSSSVWKFSCHYIEFYVPETRSIVITRVRDFHMWSNDLLPSVNSLLDGISRRARLEESTSELIAADDYENKEQLLAQALLVHLPYGLPISGATHYAINTDPSDSRLPRSFAEASRNPKWAAAIDREYKALADHNT